MIPSVAMLMANRIVVASMMLCASTSLAGGGFGMGGIVSGANQGLKNIQADQEREQDREYQRQMQALELQKQ